ncbi:hypothetical protein [Bradyrhizobium erythrophlei]|uniref:PsbP protein n=1 Tax=Bradyrhizobium erythrophlei TaxID=1437360 RepID=A0A1H5ELS1_9BRAD|nr:hypothetical protein [Bradyrhizobium erythrophlei]SED92097.1 hypothetical protein SAMN05444164_6292 [Bradyrhizobium erythrophlei]
MDISGGARLVTATLASFVVSAAVLGGAGYSASRILVAPPRDVFRAAAFDMELARGWWCEQDDSEFVCSPPGKPPHAAIAIIAMKERNSLDNLQAYEDHLKQQQRIGDEATGKLSDVRSVGRTTIGSHEWVEALHSGSELPNFDTYYLATNTSELGILVTLSVHKDYADKYVAELKQMITTLKIYQR